MNRSKFSTALLAGLLFISPVLAQVNILSNAVNFRTSSSSDQSQNTIHNGNLQIYSNGNYAGDADGTGNNSVLFARCKQTDNSDHVAVYGSSQPQPYWGIGGNFIGGYIGVEGSSSLAGVGTRYGGFFSAANGTSTNYGIYSSSYGSSTGGTNFGICSYAGGSGTNYAGYFGGNVYVSGTLTQASDAKLKTNVNPITGSLAQIQKLKPVTFQYDSISYPQMGFSTKLERGLIAQDVANVFPDIVYDEKGPASPGAIQKKKGVAGADSLMTFKSVNYIALIPVLINAVQEQQQQIDALKKVLAENGISSK